MSLALGGAPHAPEAPRVHRLALVGLGAIGQAVLAQVQVDPLLRVVQVLVRPGSDPAAQQSHRAAQAALLATLAPHALLVHALDLTDPPDLLVECAGHGALGDAVLPALRAGVPAVVASVGALHDSSLLASLAEAAEAGRTRVQLIAGAVGGIDALAAARIGGLTRVHYTGRKPPAGWRGTPAEALCDLAALRAPQQVFDGSARDAARLYPKNANVAATVSLAGLGLDATRATLWADPTVTRNTHRVVAEGAFGRLDLTLENEPLASNPKTSALTVYSVLRAIHHATRSIVL